MENATISKKLVELFRLGTLALCKTDFSFFSVFYRMQFTRTGVSLIKDSILERLFFSMDSRQTRLSHYRVGFLTILSKLKNRRSFILIDHLFGHDIKSFWKKNS